MTLQVTLSRGNWSLVVHAEGGYELWHNDRPCLQVYEADLRRELADLRRVLDDYDEVLTGQKKVK